MKHNIIPFTHSGYRKLISNFLKLDFEFTDFTSLKKKSSMRNIILRHDIDFDVDKAAEIAKIEYEEGVYSTFFFLLTSDFYNILNKENSAILMDLLHMGHKIGLHFDEANYDLSNLNLYDEYVQKEVTILSEIIGHEVDIISFHRPSKNVLDGSVKLSKSHTYESLYFKKMQYFSDSRKKNLDFSTVWNAHSDTRFDIQLLTHPIWWNKKPSSAAEDYSKFISKQSSNLLKSMESNSSIFEVSDV